MQPRYRAGGAALVAALTLFSAAGCQTAPPPTKPTTSVGNGLKQHGVKVRTCDTLPSAAGAGVYCTSANYGTWYQRSFRRLSNGQRVYVMRTESRRHGAEAKIVVNPKGSVDGTTWRTY